jgi:hypothetical protein
MKADGAPRISTGIAAVVLLLVAVYYGTEVLAPLTLATRPALQTGPARRKEQT